MNLYLGSTGDGCINYLAFAGSLKEAVELIDYRYKNQENEDGPDRFVFTEDDVKLVEYDQAESGAYIYECFAEI